MLVGRSLRSLGEMRNAGESWDSIEMAYLLLYVCMTMYVRMYIHTCVNMRTTNAFLLSVSLSDREQVRGGVSRARASNRRIYIHTTFTKLATANDITLHAIGTYNNGPNPCARPRRTSRCKSPPSWRNKMIGGREQR